MNLEATIEAILFAVGAPVTTERLCALTGESEEAVRAAAASLERRLDSENSGIQLIGIEDGCQLCTRKEAGEVVKRALELRKAPPLSKASLEVLAIVAYDQPVTRGFIEQVRGVDSSYTVAGLADKGLICECGQLDAPGRPSLFATTDAFLRCFGLSSLADLPKATFDAAGGNSASEGGEAAEGAVEGGEAAEETSENGEASEGAS